MQRFRSSQFLEEEKEELTSSKGLETISPDALFYQCCDLGLVYLKRRKETGSKAIYDRALIQMNIAGNGILPFFCDIFLLPKIAIMVFLI